MFRRWQIWKLQRPLGVGPVDATALHPVLAYTEGHENMATIPLPRDMVEHLFGDELKIYAKARVVNGVLKVKRLVPEQDW